MTASVRQTWVPTQASPETYWVTLCIFLTLVGSQFLYHPPNTHSHACRGPSQPAKPSSEGHVRQLPRRNVSGGHGNDGHASYAWKQRNCRPWLCDEMVLPPLNIILIFTGNFVASPVQKHDDACRSGGTLEEHKARRSCPRC